MGQKTTSASVNSDAFILNKFPNLRPEHKMKMHQKEVLTIKKHGGAVADLDKGLIDKGVPSGKIRTYRIWEPCLIDGEG